MDEERKKLVAGAMAKAREKLGSAQRWFKEGQQFARYLKNLKDDREEGDYEIFSTVDQTITANALREAAEFVAEAERHLQSFL